MPNPLTVVAGSITRLGRSIVALMRRLRRPATFAVSRFFIRLGVNQTHLTVVRICLLVGVYFAWVYSDLGVALAVMLLAWALDCLDGDLSRLLGNDDAVGEFEDVFADNLVFVVFPLALISTRLLGGALGALSVFAACSLLWIAERKQSADGRTLVFHPKGDLLLTLTRKAVWLLMYLYIFFRLDIFTVSYALVTALHLGSIGVNYFQLIRSRLKPLPRGAKGRL